jgi:hypothetical protein
VLSPAFAGKKQILHNRRLRFNKQKIISQGRLILKTTGALQGEVRSKSGGRF